MKLTEIIKRTLALGVLIASAGCYYNHIPDHQIRDVESTIPDAEWTKKYRGLNRKECVELAKCEPFGRMSYEELIEMIHTPLESQIYIFWLEYQNKGRKKRNRFWTSSFKKTHEDAVYGDIVNDCTEMDKSAAAELDDDGYRPLTLRMTTKKYWGKGHHAFLYRKHGKFHTVDRQYAQRNFPEGHDSVNDLMKKQWPKMKWYSVFDVSKNILDWKTTKKNLFKRFKICTERVK